MKTLLMDFFGVVSPEGHFERNILGQVCREALGTQLEVYYRQLKFSQISEQEFWEKLGWNEIDARVEMAKRIKIDPKFREVAAYLKRKGYPLVLFTDSPRCLMVDELVERHNLKVIFDKVVITPEWGFVKTQPSLYVEARKQFGDCAIVDDKLHVLELANKAGMETIWKKAVEEQASFEPEHTIRYLEELKELL